MEVQIRLGWVALDVDVERREWCCSNEIRETPAAGGVAVAAYFGAAPAPIVWR